MAGKKLKTLAQQLRGQLILVAIAFGFAIVLSLSFITWRSVEFAADNLLKMEAFNVERQLLEQSDYQLPSTKEFSVYRKWADVPSQISVLFKGEELEPNQVYERELTSEQGKLEYVSLMEYEGPQGIGFYLVALYDSAQTDELIDRVIRYMLSDAIWLLLVVYAALLLLVFWLLRKTNEPMVLLSQWANELKDDGHLARREFPISELNQLASQLKVGVDRITEYNLREQQFLKHASHEMRTPLATIQACLDTLDYQLTGPESKTVKRALKASANMRRLSMALLWLARESEKHIERTCVHLPTFVADQIEEHRYLLQNRPVIIEPKVLDVDFDIESDLLQIVLANLLRNACQYTQTGTIEVSMDAQSLVIKNPFEHESETNSDYQSFGLGLQLVSRICDKVGWQFTFQEYDGCIEVGLVWPKSMS